MDLTRFSHLLLEIHRAGRDAPAEKFQSIALELMSDFLPFDSAWWGNVSVEPPAVHCLHLHNCDASILEAYLPYMDQDFMHGELMAHPGRSINLADLVTRARFVCSALYQNVGKRYRIEWSLGTLLAAPASSLNEFLTLWRHDPTRPFTEAERQTKELLMPHMVEAHRMARLREALGDPRARRDCWAVADERGFLHEISPAFMHWLRHEWPTWQGSALPESLLPSVREALPARVGSQRLHVEKHGTYRYLRVGGSGVLDGLTAREREIVARYVQGETYAAIAAELRLSPATVRNHIAHCYRKLAVNNKVELIRRVLQDEQ